jgi:glutamate-1-semialdehyde 2,1-aminomutase
MGGAQEYFGVTPDLATFAKAIANGYSLAAVVGCRKIMKTQADNFISSTYWSDCTALAAGLATLNEINSKPVIETINKTGQRLVSHLRVMAKKHSLDIDIAGHGFNFTLNFNYGIISGKIMTLFIQEMVARGIYTNGVFYPCHTHTSEDLEKILSAADEVFALLKKGIEKKSTDQLLKCPERQTGFRRLA